MRNILLNQLNQSKGILSKKIVNNNHSRNDVGENNIHVELNISQMFKLMIGLNRIVVDNRLLYNKQLCKDNNPTLFSPTKKAKTINQRQSLFEENIEQNNTNDFWI
ncbi:unnamed protein product [Gordionus sp. m RMFG-2023]